MILIADAVILILYSIYIYKLIKILQYKEYRGVGYFEHIKNHIIETFFRLLVQFILMTIIYIGIKRYLIVDDLVTYCFIGVFLFINILIIFVDLHNNEKLKFTKKVKIIYFSNVLLIVIILIILNFYFEINTLLQLTYIASLIMVFSPILTLIGHILVKPQQNSIDNINTKQVSNKLRIFSRLTRIVVVNQEETKEVANYLKILLEEKYNVLSVKINKTCLNLLDEISENLNKETNILLVDVENDMNLIEKISTLINPNYVYMALKDDVNYKENCLKLLEKITANGKIIVSEDNKNNNDIIEKYKKRIITYGINSSKNVTGFADRIELEECQTSFRLKIKKKTEECLTRIKGEVLISYLVGCSVVCDELGMNLKEIKKGIYKI